VKERVCSPDIELLAVSLRPYYLPREFTQAIVIVVYIPPAANALRATDVINSVTVRLQTLHPSAFISISGDFKHVTLASTLSTFKQFVDCKSRENKTLDLLYANVKDGGIQLHSSPPSGQIRPQPGLPEAPLYTCSPEATSGHQNCTRVVSGCGGDSPGLF